MPAGRGLFASVPRSLLRRSGWPAVFCISSTGDRNTRGGEHWPDMIAVDTRADARGWDLGSGHSLQLLASARTRGGEETGKKEKECGVLWATLKLKTLKLEGVKGEGAAPPPGCIGWLCFLLFFFCIFFTSSCVFLRGVIGSNWKQCGSERGQP